MVDAALQVPSDIKFPEAISLTQSLLEGLEAGELSPSEILTVVSDLVKTENGARGFFVTYLTSDRAIANSPSEEIVQALRSSPEVVAELLAKNVAMSAAQALVHRRNGNEEMAQSSERVRDRTTHLIGKLNLAAVYHRCQKLLESTTTGEGDYQAFLERWGYDAEQRQLMSQALQLVLSKSHS